MGIDNICRKLLKTVCLLAVRLDLFNYEWKTTKKCVFLTKIWVSKLADLPPYKNAKTTN